MEHFVTLFDQAFPPQGLALHRSLLRVMPTALLRGLCIDSETKTVLRDVYGPYREDLRVAAAMLRWVRRAIAPYMTIVPAPLLTRLRNRLKGRRRAVRPKLL